jgi:hypothetical protein
MNGSKRGSDDELANSYVNGPLATGNLFIEVNSIGTVRTSERDDLRSPAFPFHNAAPAGPAEITFAS